MNADNNHKDTIHIIYGDKHYDAAIGIYHGNNDLDDSKEIRRFNLKQLKQENWNKIEENEMKRFLNEQHKQWKQEKEKKDKIKSMKKYKCQDCEMVMNSEQEMTNHMTDTDFDHCMFDEI